MLPRSDDWVRIPMDDRVLGLAAPDCVPTLQAWHGAQHRRPRPQRCSRDNRCRHGAARRPRDFRRKAGPNRDHPKIVRRPATLERSSGRSPIDIRKHRNRSSQGKSSDQATARRVPRSSSTMALTLSATKVQLASIYSEPPTKPPIVHIHARGKLVRFVRPFQVDSGIIRGGRASASSRPAAAEVSGGAAWDAQFLGRKHTQRQRAGSAEIGEQRRAGQSAGVVLPGLIRTLRPFLLGFPGKTVRFVEPAVRIDVLAPLAAKRHRRALFRIECLATNRATHVAHTASPGVWWHSAFQAPTWKSTLRRFSVSPCWRPCSYPSTPQTTTCFRYWPSFRLPPPCGRTRSDSRS